MNLTTVKNIDACTVLPIYTSTININKWVPTITVFILM